MVTSNGPQPRVSTCMTVNVRKTAPPANNKIESSFIGGRFLIFQLQTVVCQSGEPLSVVVTSPSLTMSAVSSTCSSTLLYALREERHFALVDGLRVSNLGSL